MSWCLDHCSICGSLAELDGWDTSLGVSNECLLALLSGAEDLLRNMGTLHIELK